MSMLNVQIYIYIKIRHLLSGVIFRTFEGLEETEI